MSGFEIAEAYGCVVTTALHAGHEMRATLRPWCALDPETRLREEDPGTEQIAQVAANRMVATRSRFEVDLNRPRSSAVYRRPEDAWGLEVWHAPLPAEEIERSLALYDEFYRRAALLLDGVVRRCGAAVVFDIHSYNHRRHGPDAPPEDVADNPEVNVGTGTLDARRWGTLAARVTQSLASDGLDVRENVKFSGGHFASWAHDRWKGDVAVLALEFKKTFMDEWTGAVDPDAVERLRISLERCVAIAEKHTTGVGR